MTRSLNKGVFIDPHLLNTFTKKVKKEGKSNMGPIRTNSRKTHIIENFVGVTFEVHNGKTYVPVKVNENMVGFCLGEFVPTRKIPVHPKKVKKRDAKKGRV